MKKEDDGAPRTYLQKFLDALNLSSLSVGSSFDLELDDNTHDQFSNKREYTNLNLHHRLFVIFENPASCLLAKLWSVAVAVVTFVSVVMYVLDSQPELNTAPSTCDSPACNNDPELCPGRMICEPLPKQVLIDIENACLYIFIIDYFTRVLLCATVPSHLASVADKPVNGSDESRLDRLAEEYIEESEKNAGTNHLDPETFDRNYFEERGFNSDKDAVVGKVKTAVKKMHAMREKISYWQQVQAEAEHSVLRRLYLWTFRPVTETNYHPSEDPVFSVHYQFYRYITNYMNMIDFVAILPFFIALSASGGGTSFSVVRVLRLARVLRVLKLGKGSKGMVILLETVRDSLPALMILAFFSLIGVVLLGAIQYFCEQGSYAIGPDGRPDYFRSDKESFGTEKSPYDSIPMSMYWVVITSTTVGFGDIYPTTYFGRLIAIVSAYGGMFVLALPISVIGNNFERIYDVYQGHLSHGVVYGIFELLADNNDVNRIIRDPSFQKMTHQQKSMELINVALTKLSAVFLLAKNLLNRSRCNHFMRLLKELHIRVYLDAKIYLEEKRLVANDNKARTIRDEDFYPEFYPEFHRKGSNPNPAMAARDRDRDSYRASRELLLRLKMIQPWPCRRPGPGVCAIACTCDNPMGTGNGCAGDKEGVPLQQQQQQQSFLKNRAQTLMPLEERESPDFEESTRLNDTLQRELIKLQAQLDVAHRALAACADQRRQKHISDGTHHTLDPAAAKQRKQLSKFTREVEKRVIAEQDKKVQQQARLANCYDAASAAVDGSIRAIGVWGKGKGRDKDSSKSASIYDGDLDVDRDGDGDGDCSSRSPESRGGNTQTQWALSSEPSPPRPPPPRSPLEVHEPATSPSSPSLDLNQSSSSSSSSSSSPRSAPPAKSPVLSRGHHHYRPMSPDRMPAFVPVATSPDNASSSTSDSTGSGSTGGSTQP